MSAALATTEATRLAELETTIERGLETFVEVGRALLEIREAKLYRAEHKTFESYCRSRWDIGRSRAYQLMDAAAVSTIVDVENEAQARELVPLKNDEAEVVAAWREATASGVTVTAKDLRNAVTRQLANAEQAREAETMRERKANARCRDCGRAHAELEVDGVQGASGFFAPGRHGFVAWGDEIGLDGDGRCRDCFVAWEQDRREQQECEEQRRREELGEDRYRKLQRRREQDERQKRTRRDVAGAVRVFATSEGVLEWLYAELDGLRKLDPADCAPQQLLALRAGIQEAEQVLSEIRSWSNGGAT